jgi:hypothetical protein
LFGFLKIFRIPLTESAEDEYNSAEHNSAELESSYDDPEEKPAKKDAKKNHRTRASQKSPKKTPYAKKLNLKLIF